MRSQPSGTPAADVEISEDLARELLLRQAPDVARQPLRYLATGWDNVVYRLGEHWVMRLPRRALAEKIGKIERQWLPRVAERSGLELPVALFEGTPVAEYPFTWSLCGYIPGSSAVMINRTERDAYADAFIDFLSRLHCEADADAPRSEFRGVPLELVALRTEEAIKSLAAPECAAAQQIWIDALAAPAYTGSGVWLHGDPHPHNTVVDIQRRGATFRGMVDFGDLCAGDPASDLGGLWLHFSSAVRDEAMASYGAAPGGALYRRARGWALRYALILHQTGDRLGEIGRETLQILCREAQRTED